MRKNQKGEITLFRFDVARGAAVAVKANIKPGDNVVILTTPDVDPVIPQQMAAAAEIFGANEAVICLMNPRQTFGHEPPRPVAEMMKGADVVFLPLSSSITHTKSFFEAVHAGARVIAMPFVNVDMLKRSQDIDVEKAREITLRCSEILSTGKEAHITCSRGTDLRVSMEGRIAVPNYGVADKEAYFHAGWPPGATHMNTLEDTAVGTIIADGPASGFGLPDAPITLRFENGWLKEIKGNETAQKIRAFLEMSDDNAKRFCEIGIGTNIYGQYSGNITEDKKKGGSIHIAIGKNVSGEEAPGISGTIVSKVHIDFVQYQASLSVDGIPVIENGKIVVG